MEPMDEFAITQDEEGHHAVRADQAVTVLPDGAARVFHRNGIKKNFRTGETTHVRWLVAELDGVRVYVHHQDIVVTRRDLYP